MTNPRTAKYHSAELEDTPSVSSTAVSRLAAQKLYKIRTESTQKFAQNSSDFVKFIATCTVYASTLAAEMHTSTHHIPTSSKLTSRAAREAFTASSNLPSRLNVLESPTNPTHGGYADTCGWHSGDTPYNPPSTLLGTPSLQLTLNIVRYTLPTTHPQHCSVHPPYNSPSTLLGIPFPQLTLNFAQCTRYTLSHSPLTLLGTPNLLPQSQMPSFSRSAAFISICREKHMTSERVPE